MALFTGRRSILKAIAGSEWSEPKERDELLAELQKSPPRATALIPVLYHWDAAVRKVGAELFVPQADQAAVEELISGLDERPPQVRTALVPVLARVPEPILRSALEELFGQTAPQARLLAWSVALSLPAEVRSGYVKRAVFEAPGALRLKAIEELVTDGADKHLAMLLGVARESDPQVSPVAVRALADVRDPQVLELMLDYLAEGDEKTREVAQEYLRNETKIDPQAMQRALLTMVTRGTDATRKAAVGILLESGDPEKVVLEVLELGNHIAGWMRARIIDALRAAGEVFLRAAVKLTQHPDEGIRTNAIMALAEGFEDQRLVGSFCRVLADPDWWLRVTACGVLGSIGDERAVPHLVRVLQDDSSRWAAIDALAQIGAPSALKPLSQLLRDPREEIRQEVLEAFSHFSELRLLPIIRAVRDRDPCEEVRGRAAEILQAMSERLGKKEEAAADAAAPARSVKSPLDQLLLRIREMGASDLHLTVGEPPMMRLHGILQRMEDAAPLTAEDTDARIRSALGDEQRKILDVDGAVDFSHVIEGVGRYRANAYVQRHGTCASFRVIPSTPPSFAELRLPSQLRELLDYHQGVIIISGPAGCGKSTTLTALVNLINETKSTHIITMEDPIEFVHPPKMALINQREVGRDTESFAKSLRAALREDPDVIIVGELRDTESIRQALEAAETGHLVIATLHTTSAVQTIDRLVGSFPVDEQAQVRMALSESLKYVVSQRLVPNKTGDGRVAVFEVLKGIMSIANMIRKNETFQIPGLMQLGRHLGMRTLDQALGELVESDLIAPETAWRNADKPETFRPLCDPEVIAEYGEPT
ncbi:MAG: PilT/PilU family type 4a pilus ATPase [bacterium]|nr:PilT/PilU family type 4a pilus ATPase [bacterium]